VALSSLKLTWRGRGFYASGSPEQELLTGANLAGVQSLVAAPGFAEKLAE
jgi:hypothetical protein